MNKLHRKDFSIAVKKGTDANKYKFAKEAVQGEMYFATDSGTLYVANTTAGARDSILTRYDFTHPFNVDSDTEANILASTPTAPSGYATKMFGSDTGNFYIYDGSWYIFNREPLPNIYSLDFDGSNDYVDAGNDSSLSISGALSVSAWIYADSLTGYPMFLSKRAESGHAYQFYSTGGKINYNNGTIVQSSGSLTLGVWTHVAVTFNGAGAVAFYINGSSAGTATAASSNPTNSGSVTIGRAYNGNYFNGKIDEVSLFNSALSASDITAIYNSGTPDDLTSHSPVGWWRMGDNDGGTGTTITDQGSGGNNGTLVNGPIFSTDIPS